MKTDRFPFLEAYFHTFKQIAFNSQVIHDLSRMCDMHSSSATAGGKILFAGNGASAAIASHCVLDYTNQCNLRAQCFNETALITALSNDYGYENWLRKAFEFYSSPADVIVFISSSGSSPILSKPPHGPKSIVTGLLPFQGSTYPIH